jgi:hypothetical protein
MYRETGENTTTKSQMMLGKQQEESDFDLANGIKKAKQRRTRNRLNVQNQIRTNYPIIPFD